MSTGAVPAAPASRVVGYGTLALGAALAGITALAWLAVLRDAHAMVMPGASASLAEGTAFTAQWGVMMAAMMLPSAAPMILLYRTVSRRLSAGSDRAIPAPAFAAVYLLAWLASGIPVYAAYVAVGMAAERWRWFDAAVPYVVAGTLVAAGAYQFTGAKRACLRDCESPLAFLMRRWRSGYAATLALAARHAASCIGCCWGLMVILVVAGAMSVPWVVLITLVVFAEKMLPPRWRASLVIGVVLIALGVAVALRPGLAGTMRGGDGGMRDHSMDMAMRPAPAPVPDEIGRPRQARCIRASSALNRGCDRRGAKRKLPLIA